MNSSLYVFASLGKGESFGIRFGGPGLGNLLFPWARAVAFASHHNLQRINSTWKTVKIGPILRGEFDKRFYSDLFEEHEIGGLKKFLLLQTSQKIPENQALEALKIESKRPRVIVFEGLEGSFHPILNDHAIVKEELLKIVLPHHKEAVETFDNRGINVHIRMGDFAVAPNEEFLRKGHWNYRLPLQWYIDVVQNIRNEIGSSIPVNIFSDGTDEELSDILKLPNVQRQFLGSAISDMLALSESQLLIASASTFSMWASYLGRIPVIWYPGVHRLKLYTEEEPFEGTLDYGEPLPEKLKNDLEKSFHPAGTTEK